MTLFILSFVGGVLTVLAPCILPLLPVIVGGSLTGGEISKKKAVIVVSSLGVSVILFTLLLKVSTLFIAIPESAWKIISGGIIIVLGFFTVFPFLWEKFSFNAILNRKSNAAVAEGYKKKSVWGDVIIGAALGPVFTTCSPTYFIVLATVLPAQPLIGFFYLIAFALGLCLSLLIIASLGQRIIGKLEGVSDPNGWFKKSLGIIFILVGIAVIFGFDKKIETAILNAGFFDVTKIEQKLLETREQDQTSTNSSGAVKVCLAGDESSCQFSSTTPYVVDQETIEQTKDVSQDTKSTNNIQTKINKDLLYKKAIELSSPDGFVNTNGKPITIAELKGKVVLLDIWTYSCINCQRTLPYLNTWYDKYKDQGLEIIGLHTPEFAFERVQKNVEDAVKRFDIQYPVVLDNDYSTWTAYGNRFWPRKYLIDIDGYIIYDHIGEGAYEETERQIQKALQEKANRDGQASLIPSDISKPDAPVSSAKSAETYFGSLRNEYFANGIRGVSGSVDLTIPEPTSPNLLYLGGTWNIQPEYAEGGVNSVVSFTYNAKEVYIVAEADTNTEIEVFQDGTLVTLGKGDDVTTQSLVTVKDSKLYKLIKNSTAEKHTLKLKVRSGKVRFYAFTFG